MSKQLTCKKRSKCKTLEESAVKMWSYQNEGKGKMFPELMVVCRVCSKSRHIALQFYWYNLYGGFGRLARRGNKMKRLMSSLDNMEENDLNSYVFIQFAYIVTPNSN